MLHTGGDKQLVDLCPQIPIMNEALVQEELFTAFFCQENEKQFSQNEFGKQNFETKNNKKMRKIMELREKANGRKTEALLGLKTSEQF